MSKIDTKDWKEFVIKDLFTVKRPSARSQADYDDGDIPFIASGNFNNGVLKYLKPKEDELLDSGNCITVSPIDGSSFYQEDDFLGRGGAGSSIILLYNSNLNLYNGYFIATVIRTLCRKYAYSDMANKDTIGSEKIKLPVDKTGNPDFSYMESYMKNLELAVSSSLTNLQSAKKTVISKDIDTSQWKEFKIDYFLQMQKQIEISPVFAFNNNKKNKVSYPFIGQSSKNNGIIDYYYLGEKLLNNKEFNNCIIIHSNTHKAYFFNEPFYLKDGHGATTIFTNEKFTKLITLYIVSILNKTMFEKFDYDVKATKEKLNDLIIKLPVDREGNPDYEYMEQFMKNKMENTKKSLKYLNISE